MKHVLVGALAMALAAVVAPTLTAQTADKAMSLGSVHLSKKVMAEGKTLDPGTYQLRLTSDHPEPAAGESPESEQYVEIMRAGKVVAREVATVVSKDDIKSIAKGDTPPASGAAKVELLKGDDYIRVWVNKGGTHYLLHLPTA